MVHRQCHSNSSLSRCHEPNLCVQSSSTETAQIWQVWGPLGINSMIQRTDDETNIRREAVKNVLAELIQSRGIERKELTRLIGLQNHSYLSRLLCAKINLSPSKCAQIEQALQIARGEILDR